MNPEERLEEIIHYLPFSSDEKAEDLLFDFVALMQCMDRDLLLVFRAHCAARNIGIDDRETVLEVIDGHLALRDILGSGD